MSSVASGASTAAAPSLQPSVDLLTLKYLFSSPPTHYSSGYMNIWLDEAQGRRGPWFKLVSARSKRGVKNRWCICKQPLSYSHTVLYAMTQYIGCNPPRLNHSRSTVYMRCDLTWSDIYVHQNSSLPNTASGHETDCEHVHWLSDKNEVYISQHSIMMIYIIDNHVLEDLKRQSKCSCSCLTVRSNKNEMFALVFGLKIWGMIRTQSNNKQTS